MSNNTNTSGGIGFLGALFLVFLALKLMGFIDWSWWWITAPLWGGFAILFLVIFIGAILVAIFK